MLLEEAYAYGLTPKEATELAPAEMAAFVIAKKKHEDRLLKLLAHMSYSAGILGSMALEPRKPKFEEVFKFEEDKDKTEDLRRSKIELMAFAVNANREAQREVNKNG